MRIGFKTRQTSDVEWPMLLATWQAADSLDEFDSGWLFDHFIDPIGGGSHEALTVATALAAQTERLQIGHLVLSNTHRHPALLAKMAVTLDHITRGRFVVGLGAGWHEAEHAMYGWVLPSLADRMDRLDAAIRVLKGMWEHPKGFSLTAAGYELRSAKCEPPPLTVGGPPVWIGTKGKRRGLRIAAELADGWNFSGALPEFIVCRDALLRHCDAVGRDPSGIEISVQLWQGILTPGRMLTELREEAVAFVRAGANHIVLPVASGDGPANLINVAREVAAPLRELTT